MEKVNFTDKEIKELAHFCCTNKAFQKKLAKQTEEIQKLLKFKRNYYDY